MTAAVPVVLPAGHALGPLHDGSGPAVMVVRVGARPRRLDVDQAVVWDLAHRLADDTPLCGTDLLLEHAGEVGISDPAGVVAALVAAGPLVHVPTEPTAMAAMARRFQAYPLLIGLGLAPDSGWAVLGLPGRPVLQLPRPQAPRWKRTSRSVDLWEAAQAAAALVTGTPDDEDPDDEATARELPAVLGDLAVVVSHHAGHLDTVPTDS